VSDSGIERRDVLIAGAGLVGLSLAAALARDGLTVALLDRNGPPAAADPDTWDARVYAISPGSASFLSRIGAWQALSCDRIAAIESMRIVGDTGATLGFSAYELGERALAWIVEERALRAALLPAVHAPAAAWFLWLTWTNDVAKALLAAYLLQYANGNPVRFNTVRRYATYLGIAVLLAPVLSGLFGALLRHLALGHPFWPAFGQWALGDVLANLVVTPALLLWLTRAYVPLRPRLFEAIVWGIGFAFCLYFAVLSDQSVLAIYAPFPFLVWAALRLGTIGASSGRPRVSTRKTSALPLAHARLVGTLVPSAMRPQITAPNAALPMIAIW